jgi:hypothetical protein
MKTETPNNSKKPSSGEQNSKTNSNRITVKSAVLNALKSGVHLTQHDATFLYGTSRLGAVIHELRKEGYDIHTGTLEVDAAKGKPTAHKAHIAVYSMVGGAQV